MFLLSHWLFTSASIWRHLGPASLPSYQSRKLQFGEMSSRRLLPRGLRHIVSIPRPGTAPNTAKAPKHVQMLSRLLYSEIIIIFHALFTHDHDLFKHESSYGFPGQKIRVLFVKRSLGED